MQTQFNQFVYDKSCKFSLSLFMCPIDYFYIHAPSIFLKKKMQVQGQHVISTWAHVLLLLAFFTYALKHACLWLWSTCTQHALRTIYYYKSHIEWTAAQFLIPSPYIIWFMNVLSFRFSFDLNMFLRIYQCL